jgi:hypothetical protein
MKTSNSRERLILLLLIFDGNHKPLIVVHVKFGAKINYKSNFQIMREISAVGQSHNHGDDGNFDFARQY